MVSMLTRAIPMLLYAQGTTVSNATTGVSTLNFHSIDLNAYLYKEKQTMAKMAAVLGNVTGAAYWKASAEALLPLLQSTFFHVSPVDGSGFYQDKFFNGTALDIQGCEGVYSPSEY